MNISINKLKVQERLTVFVSFFFFFLVPGGWGVGDGAMQVLRSIDRIQPGPPALGAVQS